MTTTDSPIPCKRPKVTIETSTAGPGLYSVECWVPGCVQHVYGPAIKSDAQEHAKWHRGDHRAAVPKVESKTVHDADGAPREADQCQWCGWVTTPGTVTKTDRDASVAYHLSKHHGLVQ